MALDVANPTGGSNNEVLLTVEVRGEAALRRVSRDLNRSTSAINQTSRSFGRLNSAMSVARNHLTTIATLVGTAFGAGAALRAADTMESYRITLRGVLHDMRLVTKVQKDLSRLAAKTPFRFEDIFGGAGALLSTGAADTRNIEKRIALIGDLSAQFGLNLQEAISNVIRIGGAGVGAADLFRDKGILAALNIAGDFGVKGEEILSKMFASIEEKFGGATEEQAKTFGGKISTFGDALFQFGVVFAEQTPLMENAKSALDLMTSSVNSATESLNKLAEGTEPGEPSFGDYAGASFDAAVEGVAAIGRGIGEGILHVITPVLEAGAADREAGVQYLRGMPVRSALAGIDSPEIIAEAQAKAQARQAATEAAALPSDPFIATRQYDATIQKLLTTLTGQEKTSNAYTNALENSRKSLDNWNNSTDRLTDSFRSQYIEFHADRGRAQQQAFLGDQFDEAAFRQSLGAAFDNLGFEDRLRSGDFQDLLPSFSPSSDEAIANYANLLQSEESILESIKAKGKEAAESAVGITKFEDAVRSLTGELSLLGKTEVEIFSEKQNQIMEDTARTLEKFSLFEGNIPPEMFDRGIKLIEDGGELRLEKARKEFELLLEDIKAAGTLTIADDRAFQNQMALIEASGATGEARARLIRDLMSSSIQGFDSRAIERELESAQMRVADARAPFGQGRTQLDDQLAGVERQRIAFLTGTAGAGFSDAEIQRELDQLSSLAEQYTLLAEITQDHPLKTFWMDVYTNNEGALKSFAQSMDITTRHITDQEPILRAAASGGEDLEAVYLGIADSGKLMAESIKNGESSLSDAFNHMKTVLAARVSDLLVDAGVGLSLAAPIAAIGGPQAAGAFLQLWFGSAASLFGDIGFQRGADQAIANDAARGFAMGGMVHGPGTGMSDSIPALLSDGEFVMNAESTRRYRTILEAMNRNRYQAGGPVGRRAGYDVEREGGILGGIRVNIQNNLGVKADARVSTETDQNGRIQAISAVLDSVHGGTTDRVLKNRYGLRNAPR